MTKLALSFAFLIATSSILAEGKKEILAPYNSPSNVFSVYIDDGSRKIAVADGSGKIVADHDLPETRWAGPLDAIFVSPSRVAFVVGEGPDSVRNLRVWDFRTGKVSVLTDGGGVQGLFHGAFGQRFFIAKNDQLGSVDIGTGRFTLLFDLAKVEQAIQNWYRGKPDLLRKLYETYGQDNLPSISHAKMSIDIRSNDLYIVYGLRVFRYLPSIDGVEFIHDAWNFKIVNLKSGAFFYYVSEQGLNYFRLDSRNEIRSYYTNRNTLSHQEGVADFWILDEQNSFILLDKSERSGLMSIGDYLDGIAHFDGKSLLAVGSPEVPRDVIEY